MKDRPEFCGDCLDNDNGFCDQLGILVDDEDLPWCVEIRKRKREERQEQNMAVMENGVVKCDRECFAKRPGSCICSILVSPAERDGECVFHKKYRGFPKDYEPTQEEIEAEATKYKNQMRLLRTTGISGV